MESLDEAIVTVPRVAADAVVGTWDSDCFQVFAAGPPPPLFDMLGFYCVPMCGVYGEDYTPCGPIGLVSLPVTNAFMHHKLSPSVRDALHHGGFIAASESAEPAAVVTNVQAYIVLHSTPLSMPCQKFTCDNTDEVNMMFHCWCYPRVEFNMDLEVTSTLLMGLFDARGVRPVHLDVKDSGIVFDALSPRTCTIHNCRFSPENAQFQLCHDRSVASFTAVAVHTAEQRCVISLHVLPCDDVGEAAIRRATATAADVGELLSRLASGHCDDAVATISRWLAAV